MKKVVNLGNPHNLEAYLFSNGYLKYSLKAEDREGYDIVISTPKWVALLQYCFEKNGINKIITPEDLVDAIQNCKRIKPKYYRDKLLHTK